MNTITKLSFGSAQAIADQVALSNNASEQGVMILVAPRGADHDLFFHINSTRNRALESTSLLCSATSMARLDAHVAGFIANLGGITEDSSGLTESQVWWARTHDWFSHSLKVGDNQYVLTVLDRLGDGRQILRQFTDISALRDWAGY